MFPFLKSEDLNLVLQLFLILYLCQFQLVVGSCRSFLYPFSFFGVKAILKVCFQPILAHTFSNIPPFELFFISILHFMLEFCSFYRIIELHLLSFLSKSYFQLLTSQSFRFFPKLFTNIPLFTAFDFYKSFLLSLAFLSSLSSTHFHFVD